MNEVFRTFLALGLTSFGGPIAHLGYFRREFVERRAWLDEPLFTHLVAFCSILPGPTSSQVGLLVGLIRAGPAGALAAWLGFTLPSAVALTVFGLLIGSVARDAGGAPPALLTGLLAGLGAAATAVVAQAVLGMAKTLCTDRITRSIALAAAALALAVGGTTLQWLPIAASALAGSLLCARTEPTGERITALPKFIPHWASLAAGVLFGALVALAIAVEHRSPAGFFVATLVRAGSLVFGGGHVVLPLLRSLVPAGLISDSVFYAGYGATQAMPGPLFTFAAFLGAANGSALHGLAGAAIAIGLIFIPSFLLLFALLPVIGALRENRWAPGALRGANAGVVGLLAALLYSPLLLTLSASVARISIAALGFGLIAVWKTPPWIGVLVCALTGALAALTGMLS